jgi:hypothetical protein
MQDERHQALAHGHPELTPEITALRVVDTCFALADGRALYNISPLQRRLRDMHVAAYHATIHQRHHTGAAKLVLA